MAYNESGYGTRLPNADIHCFIKVSKTVNLQKVLTKK